MKNNSVQTAPGRAEAPGRALAKPLCLSAIALSLAMTACNEKVIDPIEPPLPPVAVTLSGRINQDRILEDLIADPLLPDYIATDDVEINARLTIRPGVVIAVARDARFTVLEQKGIIEARGTAEKKIRFVGQQPVRGFWSGMVNHSESTANVLEHVDIMHTGSKTMLDNKKMALVLARDSQMSVKNCLFAESGGYGMFVQGDAVIGIFEQNTFKNNSEASIHVPTDLVPKLDKNSIFSGGNGRDVVEISGSYIGETGAKNEIVWEGFADKTPYRLMETVAVRTGWKLQPGVTIEVTRNEAIIIDDQAYLLARGTQAAKISFGGVGAETATWRGILIQSSDSRNALEYAAVKNAGSSTIINGTAANIALYGDGAYIGIRNTSISGSGGYGLYVGSGSKVNADVETTNEYINNRSGDYLLDGSPNQRRNR